MASYYGCDRLASMCEKALADQLEVSHPGIAADVHSSAELAPRLLSLALEYGLGKLEASAPPATRKDCGNAAAHVTHAFYAYCDGPTKGPSWVMGSQGCLLKFNLNDYPFYV